MVWTDFEDVQNRWVGGSLPADEAQVTTLIGDAEDTILREFPNIQDRIDSNELPLARVKKVVAAMVMRVLRNPKGHRTTSEGAGPFQQSVTFGGEQPGALYLTGEERAELSSPTALRGKAFSVDMTPALFAYGPQLDFWEPVR